MFWVALSISKSIAQDNFEGVSTPVAKRGCRVPSLTGVGRVRGGCAGGASGVDELAAVHARQVRFDRRNLGGRHVRRTGGPRELPDRRDLRRDDVRGREADGLQGGPRAGPDLRGLLRRRGDVGHGMRREAREHLVVVGQQRGVDADLVGGEQRDGSAVVRVGLQAHAGERVVELAQDLRVVRPRRDAHAVGQDLQPDVQGAVRLVVVDGRDGLLLLDGPVVRALELGRGGVEESLRELGSLSHRVDRDLLGH